MAIPTRKFDAVIVGAGGAGMRASLPGTLNFTRNRFGVSPYPATPSDTRCIITSNRGSRGR